MRILVVAVSLFLLLACNGSNSAATPAADRTSVVTIPPSPPLAVDSDPAVALELATIKSEMQPKMDDVTQRMATAKSAMDVETFQKLSEERKSIRAEWERRNETARTAHGNK